MGEDEPPWDPHLSLLPLTMCCLFLSLLFASCHLQSLGTLSPYSQVMSPAVIECLLPAAVAGYPSAQGPLGLC